MQRTMRQIMRLITATLIFIMLPAQAEQLAGEITAALGETLIVASAGGERAAALGMPLYVGDILQTGAGGHIHIRMVDDALVSLRPNSELKITRYVYQPGVAATIQIQFDLLHGTVRSVTGKGGELAKDRFRMNTPIAAIGVRGTDFIAQADTENTRVHVASGAIVLAPLGAGCLESALGSCQTASARVLTAEMRYMMLEITRSMPEPRLVPLTDKLQTTDPQAAGSTTKPQPKIAVEATGQVLQEAGWQINALDSIAAQAPAVQAPAVPVHYQMVWGRWLWNSHESGMDIPYTEAVQGREVTIGNMSAGLFRDNSGPLLMPRSGRAEFTLRQAQVELAQTADAIAGQVQGGTLGVDFNARKFDTQLNVSHPALADAASLKAAGRLRDDGMLFSMPSASNGTVVGSLSRDATEAGYMFTLPTAAGNLTGTTLWVK